MDAVTFQAISQQLLADADAFQVNLEKQCSDFLEKANVEFAKHMANSQKVFQMLFPTAPSTEPVA